MNSAAYDLAQFLHTLGVGVFGQTLHVGTMPEEPDDAIVIYDTGGSEPDTDEMDVFRPSVRVRVRAKSYQEGYAKQELLRQVLDDNLPIFALSSRFSLVMPSDDIQGEGKDENDRHLFVVNYKCMRSAL